MIPTFLYSQRAATPSTQLPRPLLVMMPLPGRGSASSGENLVVHPSAAPERVRAWLERFQKADEARTQVVSERLLKKAEQMLARDEARRTGGDCHLLPRDLKELRKRAETLDTASEVMDVIDEQIERRRDKLTPPELEPLRSVVRLNLHETMRRVRLMEESKVPVPKFSEVLYLVTSRVESPDATDPDLPEAEREMARRYRNKFTVRVLPGEDVSDVGGRRVYGPVHDLAKHSFYRHELLFVAALETNDADAAKRVRARLISLRDQFKEPPVLYSGMQPDHREFRQARV